MEDETRYATVTLSPAAIMWADGDIWVQKLDSPKKTAMKKQGRPPYMQVTHNRDLLWLSVVWEARYRKDE